MRRPFLRIHFPANSGRKLSTAEVIDAFCAELRRSPCQGLRLPPIRMIAHQLSMSKASIQAVYDELVARDLIESRRRIGLWVKGPPGDMGRSDERAGPRASLPALAPVPAAIARGRRLQPSVIDLSRVLLDPSLAPRAQLRRAIESVIKRPGLQPEYDPLGHPALRYQVARRLSRFGIRASADEVVVTVGSQQALDIVCRVLARPVIALESPTYALGRHLFEMNRMTLVGLPVDPFRGIDLNRWEETIRRTRPGVLYLVSTFQNPTGYSYTSAELAAIAEWSAKYRFGIVEDDWGSEMLSHSEFRPPLRATGGDNVFYVNSFTKKVLPSLRIGYVVGNGDTIAGLAASKRVSSLGSPMFMEAALAEFLDRGYYDVHLELVHAELDARYRSALSILRRTMPESVRWTTPGGGPLLWLELPKQVDASALAQHMEKVGVRIAAPSDAFLGPPHLNGVKLGFAYNPVERTTEGIERLAQGIRAMLVARH